MTPSRRAIRLRLKSLVMIPHDFRLAVRTRCASISTLGVTSSSTTSSGIVESFCISVRTSSPRRPRRRRVASAESATCWSSRSTELRMISGMSTKPVFAMSRMRPSMITEVSSRTPVRRWLLCSAAAAEEKRRQLGPACEPDRGALGGEQQGKDRGHQDPVWQVPHEDTDESGDHQSDDHAEEPAQQVGQRGAGQPEVEGAPAAEHVRRAQVGEDQAFQRGQADDHVAGIRVGPAADQEIAEQKAADQAERRP